MRSGQETVAAIGENERVYERLRKGILRTFENLKMVKSGLVINYIDYGEVTFSRTLDGGKVGHHIPLSDFLRKKKVIVNIQNKDNQCFKWALLRALYMDEEKRNRTRVTLFLKRKATELDWSGITEKDIVTFERNNKIGVSEQ